MKKPPSNHRTLYFIAPIIFLVTAAITLIRGEVSISMTFLSIGIIFLIIALYEGKGIRSTVLAMKTSLNQKTGNQMITSALSDSAKPENTPTWRH